MSASQPVTNAMRDLAQEILDGEHFNSVNTAKKVGQLCDLVIRRAARPRHRVQRNCDFCNYPFWSHQPNHVCCGSTECKKERARLWYQKEIIEPRLRTSNH